MLTKKYVVQLFTDRSPKDRLMTRKRWMNTNWTKQGKPVSLRAAKLAMRRAQKRFPDSQYRVHEVRCKKASA